MSKKRKPFPTCFEALGNRFRWNSIWPGAYRLEVRSPGGRRPLVRIEDVQITGGELNEDPRLESIDLRGKLRSITIRVHGTDHRPIPEAELGSPMVLIHDGTPDGELARFPARDGGAIIITGDAYLDLLVVANGFRPEELSGVTSDTTVRMEAFPEMQLKIVGGVPELPDGHSLRVSISGRDPRRTSFEGRLSDFYVGPRFGQRQELGSSGEVSLQFEGDGMYSVTVTVGNNPLPQVKVEGIEPAEIEVRASMGRQVFEIRIPQEELTKTLERLAVR